MVTYKKLYDAAHEVASRINFAKWDGSTWTDPNIQEPSDISLKMAFVKKSYEDLDRSCRDIFAELLDEKKITIEMNLSALTGLPSYLLITYKKSINKPGLIGDLDAMSVLIDEYNNSMQDIIVGIKRLKDEYVNKSTKIDINLSQNESMLAISVVLSNFDSSEEGKIHFLPENRDKLIMNIL